ncbi:MAG: class I SAM-dependent rRNA methyltransferase [Candidatus Omnitrophica bacterium]|nr:class I SAM-dependent rRNA methyltransferase [Candidatus Omnitrophota bacterium]MDD5311367.1 class I SAM-dependent rRNA methyltransferase [Candidatus Omnitrophota bacterium]MDD5546948.1 class I SAM-dependent rRNA methyltransferase [Candidatus Omnitrophota bacterium]
MQTPSLRITRKGAAWFRTGHPWIYKDDLERNDPSLSGSIISVLDNSGKFIAKAFYNERSKIALRIITYDDVPVDAGFWRSRLSGCIEYRKKTVKDADAYRIAHSEADGLPSLIVDKYGEHLSIQTLCLGMDNIKDTIVDGLKDLLKPASIVARNDSAMRKFEGLEEKKEVLYGRPPEKAVVREGNIKYLVDIMSGQKTGAYLDQRENHIASEKYSRGKALDCFSYQGLFSLHMALSAGEVTAVDSSGPALRGLKENAELNGLTKIETVEGKVSETLKSFQKEERQFDFIVLDPPAFAKSKKDIQAAARGYIDINFRAMKLLKKGGHLMTCSCSYNLSEGQFMDILAEALSESRRRARLIEKRIQPADHPILLNFPESNYLKCIILEMV